MMDKRVAYRRDVLEGLLDSLEATMRLARWPEAEAVPPALKSSAATLSERLGVANRLTNDQVQGAPTAKKAMEEISKAIRYLDGVYVEYRKSMGGSPAEQLEGAGQLEAGIARVRGNSRLWS
jgi:hypothetical protein